MFGVDVRPKGVTNKVLRTYTSSACVLCLDVRPVPEPRGKAKIERGQFPFKGSVGLRACTYCGPALGVHRTCRQATAIELNAARWSLHGCVPRPDGKEYAIAGESEDVEVRALLANWCSPHPVARHHPPWPCEKGVAC